MKTIKTLSLILLGAASLFNSQQAVAQGAQGETLYNGIKLPAQWPPRYAEPSKAQSMPVPYLRQKPEVIPVNVGRQLFVDSFLIASTNLQTVFHQPDLYAGNPVLQPTADEPDLEALIAFLGTQVRPLV